MEEQQSELPVKSSDSQAEGLRLDSSASPPKRKRRKPKKLLSGEVGNVTECDQEMKDETQSKPKQKKPRKSKKQDVEVVAEDKP